MSSPSRQKKFSLEVVLLSLGVMLTYIPVMTLTRMASQGLFPSHRGMVVGWFEIMPLYCVGIIVLSVAFSFLTGWNRFSRQFTFLGLSLPIPRWFVVLSSVMIIGQIITMQWIYAYGGISIVFASLLMKGGLFVVAPLVDLTMRSRRRRIYWPSWVASVMSLAALILPFLEKVDTTITLACALDIFMYLVVYYCKITILSRYAKNNMVNERKRYIAEEQLSLSLILLIAMPIAGVVGLATGIEPFQSIWNGFTRLPASGFILEPIVIGLASTTSGICASLVLLDRRENTFCVTLIQSGSVIAGAISSAILAFFWGQTPPSVLKLLSVAIVLAAIVVLSYRDAVERRRQGVNLIAGFASGQSPATE